VLHEHGDRDVVALERLQQAVRQGAQLESRIALTGATNGELPEPASLGLVLAAGLGALAARRQRKAA